MAAGTSASTSNLGKRPIKWYFNDEEILHLPSRKAGMNAATELRCRKEAAEFIQEMAERLNHNVPQNRGQINQNCICIAMVHMHRFFIVHPFQLFKPKDIAAACLFLAGKSEECPRKLEHITEVWFKLKHKKAEVQPPFNDTVRKNGAELIVFLEQILLQTIGFDLHVGLPHPIVIQNMEKFKLDNQTLINCAYWFATDIIQLTNWCIRYSERTIACVCIYIACSWADYEIPESAVTPWFRDIDPDMTEELLNKLTDEFTLVYEECNNCHARRFIQKAKNENPSTMPAKSIAQLPPPPPPPALCSNNNNNTETKIHLNGMSTEKRHNHHKEQNSNTSGVGDKEQRHKEREHERHKHHNNSSVKDINKKVKLELDPPEPLPPKKLKMELNPLAPKTPTKMKMELNPPAAKTPTKMKMELDRPPPMKKVKIELELEPPPPPPPSFSPNGQSSPPPPPPPPAPPHPIDGNGNNNDLEEGEVL